MPASLPSQRRKARRCLVQALYQWQVGGSSCHAVESQFHSDNRLSGADTKYFDELLRGVATATDELDNTFAAFLDRDIKALDPVSLAILRIATYELIYRIDVPYRIAINEAINLAKTFGPTDAHKFINGVVDRVAAQTRKTEVAGSAD